MKTLFHATIHIRGTFFYWYLEVLLTRNISIRTNTTEVLENLLCTCNIFIHTKKSLALRVVIMN